MTAFAMKAQQTLSRYDISYITEHHVLGKDGFVNVVDIDFEWPEIVEFGKAEKLQKALCDSLFHYYNQDMPSSKQHFLDSFGHEITKLDTIPDDDCFNYYSLFLKEMGLRQGRFISFLATFEINPGKRKGGKQQIIDYSITYDVNNDVVLNEKDLLNLESVLSYGDNRFANYVYSLFNKTNADMVIGPFPVTEDNMSFKVYYTDAASSIIYVDNSYVGHLRKAYKKMLKTEPKEFKMINLDSLSDNTASISNDGNIDTTYIYNKVDEQPFFDLNGEKLPQYMASHLNLPKDVSVEKPLKRALVRFVVECDGSLSNFHIIQPSSPMVDRYIIDLLRQMPYWTPGKIKKQPVRSVCIIPVTVQL